MVGKNLSRLNFSLLLFDVSSIIYYLCGVNRTMQRMYCNHLMHYIMNRLFLSVALFVIGVCARAQTYVLNGVEHETTIVPVTVKNFNGQTLAAAPAGKSKTLMLYRTKFSKPLDDYNALALPELKLGNIIGHPTLGWDDTDYRIPDDVPEIYGDGWVLNDVFYDGDYPVAIYGRAPYTELLPWGESELDISRRGRDPHLIMLMDPSKNVKKVYNTAALTFPPKNRGTDSDRQSVNWAVVKDGILYFSTSGLLGFDGGQNAYLTAVDTQTDKTLWMSKPQTSNANNFLVIDNSIVCGYGESDKPDFVYVLNRFTGQQKQKLWIAHGADWFALGSDGMLYVSIYGQHIAFKVKR